jgi:hypothetical protein
MKIFLLNAQKLLMDTSFEITGDKDDLRKGNIRESKVGKNIKKEMTIFLPFFQRMINNYLYKNDGNMEGNIISSGGGSFVINILKHDEEVIITGEHELMHSYVFDDDEDEISHIGPMTGYIRELAISLLYNFFELLQKNIRNLARNSADELVKTKAIIRAV